MNKVLVFLSFLGLSWCSPVEQTVIFNEDGSYRFNFDTGKEAGSIARHEERQADGTVIGRYSYEDPTGSVRVVNYRAGRQGFIATGDVGVAGAPPAQVPVEVPPVPEQPVQEEPDQNLHPGQEPADQEKHPEPVKHETPVVVHTDSPVTTEKPLPVEEPSKPASLDEPIKVAIPDDSGRKREAGSPPISYSDNFYPFAAPVFGKRRLDIPEEDDKTAAEDEADKKKEPAAPPMSYVPQFVPQYFNPYAQQPQKPVPVEDKRPQAVPESRPPEYFYYYPVSPHFGYFPGSHPAPQPVVPAPKAWAYIPVSAFPQQHMAPVQPSGPPTNLVYIQPHAVSYIPGGANEGQAPPPQEPSSNSGNDQDSQVQTSPVSSNPTRSPSGITKPPVIDQNVPVPAPDKGEPVPVPIPEQPAFHRPTVHHYHFRGPSHTYGYYYQY